MTNKMMNMIKPRHICSLSKNMRDDVQREFDAVWCLFHQNYFGLVYFHNAAPYIPPWSGEERKQWQVNEWIFQMDPPR